MIQHLLGEPRTRFSDQNSPAADVRNPLSHVKRLFGFSMMPALSMLASLALLPLIASKFGASGWVALAVGQSIGAIVGVFGALAWPVMGGHRIAQQTREERIVTYRTSTFSRLLALGALVPITSICMLFSPFELVLPSILFMIGAALNAMSASWYFSGTGEPRFLIRNEGLVRLGSYAVALVGMSAGLGLWWYGLMMVAANLLTLVMNWLTVVGPIWAVTAVEIRGAAQLIRTQMGATLSRVLQSLFYQGANTIFAVFAPAALAVYSATDQIKRVAGNAIGVVPAAFVGWVGSSTGRKLLRRQSLSLMVAISVSLVAAAAWWLLGDRVVHYLFAGEIELTRAQKWLLFGGIIANFLTYSVELLVMIPSRLEKIVYRANSIASVLGLVAMAIGARMFGVEGGLMVLLLVKLVLLITYGLSLGIVRRTSQRVITRAPIPQ